jgi:hypothetical protein
VGLCTLLVGCTLRVPATTAPADTYYVRDGRLYDPCGEELVMRGINHPTMYEDRAGRAMPEIAKTGANVVRLFWFGGHGIPFTALEPAIEAVLANGMLPMLELHDSTGRWELDPIVAWWTEPAIVALIARHEQHLIVNIANEATAPNDVAFLRDYRRAISSLRSAGIHVPLVIDGGMVGRDYEQVLRHGDALLAADPLHNVLVSAHLLPTVFNTDCDQFDMTTRLAYESLFGWGREVAVSLPASIQNTAKRPYSLQHGGACRPGNAGGLRPQP